MGPARGMSNGCLSNVMVNGLIGKIRHMAFHEEIGQVLEQ